MNGRSITLKDVYDIVNRLEDKVDQQLGEQDKRITSLENSQAKAYGILSVFTVFTGAAGTFIWNRVLGKE